MHVCSFIPQQSLLIRHDNWFIRHEVFIIAARHWFPATDMKIVLLINHSDRKEYNSSSATLNRLIFKLKRTTIYITIYGKSRTLLCHTNFFLQ